MKTHGVWLLLIEIQIQKQKESLYFLTLRCLFHTFVHADIFELKESYIKITYLYLRNEALLIKQQPYCPS